MNRMVTWNTGSLIGLLFRYVTTIIHNEYIWIFLYTDIVLSPKTCKIKKYCLFFLKRRFIMSPQTPRYDKRGAAHIPSLLYHRCASRNQVHLPYILHNTSSRSKLLQQQGSVIVFGTVKYENPILRRLYTKFRCSCPVCIVVQLVYLSAGTGIAESILRFATRWTVRGSKPGGRRDSPCLPDRPRGPPSLLCKGYWVLPRGEGGKSAIAWC